MTVGQVKNGWVKSIFSNDVNVTRDFVGRQMFKWCTSTESSLHSEQYDMQHKHLWLDLLS